MKIQIKYTNFDHSPILHQYIEKKIGTLERLIKRFDTDGVALARVEVGRTSQHHHKGSVYRAEINLDLPGKMLRAVDEDWDIRVALDKARDRLRREVMKYKERLKE